MFRAPQLRRTLEAALRDRGSTSATTRASALRDLIPYADMARAQVLSALEQSLRDESSEVRATAALGLADVRGVEALPALLFAVEDEDAYVRQMALSAVGELGDPRSRERLRRALSDPRPEVRFQAIIGFVRVAPDEAVAALARALEDADSSIRYIALRCAEEHAEECGQAIPPHLLAQAERLLEDSNEAVRVAAAIVLARSGNRRSLAVLLDVAKGRVITREAEDEAMAVELLGELHIEEATPYLERRAFGLLRSRTDRFSWQAMVALARMGHERARSRIVRDLGSWSRDRRTLAVAAAGQAGLLEARAIIEAMRGDDRRAEPGTVDLTLSQLGEGKQLEVGSALAYSGTIP